MEENYIRPPAPAAQSMLKRRRIPVWAIFPEIPDTVNFSPQTNSASRETTCTVIHTGSGTQSQWYGYRGQDSHSKDAHINSSESIPCSIASYPTSRSSSSKTAQVSKEHNPSRGSDPYSSPGAGSLTRGKSPYIDSHTVRGHTNSSKQCPSRKTRSWTSWVLQSNSSWAPNAQSASSKSPSTTSSTFAENFKLERALGWLSNLPSPEPSPSAVNKTQPTFTRRHQPPPSFDTVRLPSPVYLGGRASSAAASTRTLYLPTRSADPSSSASIDLGAAQRHVLFSQPPTSRRWHFGSIPRLAKEYLDCHIRLQTPSYISEELGPELSSSSSSSTSILVVGTKESVPLENASVSKPGLPDSTAKGVRPRSLLSKNSARPDSTSVVEAEAKNAPGDEFSLAQRSPGEIHSQSDVAISDRFRKCSTDEYKMEKAPDYAAPYVGRSPRSAAISESSCRRTEEKDGITEGHYMILQQQDAKGTRSNSDESKSNGSLNVEEHDDFTTKPGSISPTLDASKHSSPNSSRTDRTHPYGPILRPCLRGKYSSLSFFGTTLTRFQNSALTGHT
ncbi:hypothetical protein L228DRAFT_41104 [Xylona heveae TC161]|uniref:Uncharacterized protein n=1 Tax=Xylona heveae (strain CBS 132557 / TC161) TaxID=1328760 RepID=A0A165A0W2_XYLHT|nr:hypothetical protein L228DRAFT_41104 [Xylona heveae TC161]KZF19797.1 hypothetical protein L228DRAFT_41104 [Xylona heveae TC161]